MKTIHHTADSRGTAFFGWLNSRHTFSFGHYHNPDRINFGALRVLNDDIVAPGKGFGTHPHDNMEIVSIPLQGTLEHQDSTGNTEVIHSGDVQIMSAGSGLTHSEYNHSKTERVNFLQVWVLPKERDIKPRYEQKTYLKQDRINKLQTVVAPDDQNAVWINQQAWFHLSTLKEGFELKYQLKDSNNGVYLFVLGGEVAAGNTTLGTRDGLGVYDTQNFDIRASQDAELLLIEVPMTF
ncbi:MAG: pirin family protein [Cyclobacteriaceae bacterium]|nr:pirin family protein [Cyclobacteriaceae bacterium HetDA_MAG_MS6]